MIRKHAKGVSEIKQTRVYSTVGGEVAGAGTGVFTKNSKLKGDASYVYTSLPVSERITGANWKLHDYHLIGQGRPDIGTLISQQLGAGTGECDFWRRTWTGFKTAVQFGESVDMNACDSMNFDRNWFNDCDTVFKFVNLMAMTNTFEDVNVINCGNIFQVHGGGKNIARDVFTGGGARPGSAVLDVHGTLGPNEEGKTVDLGIGSNNNWFNFENICMDDNTDSNLALVRINRSLDVPYKVVIRGGSITYDWYKRDNNFQLDLWNPFHITIYDYLGLQPGTLRVHYDPTKPMGTIELLGCHFTTRIKRLKDTPTVHLDGIFDAADYMDRSCSGWGHTNILSRGCHTASGEILRPTEMLGVK